MSSRRRPPAPRPKHRNARRPGLEAMEARQLMAVVPYAPAVDLSTRNWQDVQVPTTPMYATPITGIMPTSSFGYGDRYEFYLNKGEVADVSVDIKTLYNINTNYAVGTSTIPGQVNSSSVSIYNIINGVPSAQVGGNSAVNADTDVIFQAPAAGWYQASLHTPNLPAGPAGFTPIQAQYTSYVRPIALDPTSDSQLNPNANAADVTKLDFAGGGMYAFLTGRSTTANTGLTGNTGTALDLSGPTGRGFAINGNWTETENASTITYTGTNLILEVANPAAPNTTIGIPLPAGPIGLAITAQRDTGNDVQGLYGLVTTEPSFTYAGLNLDSPGGLVSSISSQFGVNLSSYGIGASTPGVTWGIDLGSVAAASAGNVPLNSAVPYLWFNLNVGTGGSVTLGGVGASVGKNFSFSAAVDPEDPSFYLDIAGVPIVTDLGLGFSVNGLIPYYPTAGWVNSAPFFGDVYAKGTLDLGPLTDDTVPVQLSGSFVVNLDPRHYGLANIASNLKNDIKNLTSDLGSGVTTTSDLDGLQDLYNDSKSIEVGVNGLVTLGLAEGGVNFSIPLAAGSAEWDGANHFDFGLATVNPLAGTPVSFLTSASAVQATGEFDTIPGGQFFVDLQGKWGILGQTLANGDFYVTRKAAGGAVSVAIYGRAGISEGGSVLGIGATANVSENISILMDTNGNGSLWVNGLAQASGIFAGTTYGSDTESYSWSGQGNIAALITSQYNNVTSRASTAAKAWWGDLIADIFTGYRKASNAITGWF